MVVAKTSQPLGRTKTKNHSLGERAIIYIYPAVQSIQQRTTTQANLHENHRGSRSDPKAGIEEESTEMAASTVLVLALAVLLLPAASSAARAPPGSSPLVETCKEGPFPAHCIKELGPRLLDIQTELASASPRGALIAGAPGTVDFSSLVAVALETATEAGAVASTIFEGKLPGFNNSVPDFKKCLDNCTVTMKSAMKKLRGASAAMKVHAHKVAETLANKAIVDVSSCTLSCHNLTGDMRLILETSLVEFQKMLRIAVNFISKLAAKTPPGPPMRGPPPVRRP